MAKESNNGKQYIAIDLKSFYASVECMELGLDPLNTNLVVADESRTSKTICLAVSPSLKVHGISGRARLFEVEQRVKEVNRQRAAAYGKELEGKSHFADELKEHPEYAVDYLVARPRMAHYIKSSTEIYNVYLKYIAPEDIHVYSIDEVFIDATGYLKTYGKTAKELASMMIQDVYQTTGITATGGIGTNLYLCKVAMDMMAKHADPDEYGVRIAELDERTYREQLWGHKPITDFWRVGRGTRNRLAEVGIYTMGDIARCSIGKERDYHNEELLYKIFGVNAELLIDHAWGWEPCTMEEVKAYKPETNSFSSGQVLNSPYSFEKARLVVQEMVDSACLDLVDRGLVTDQIVLTVGYDIENLTDPEIRKRYKGPITTDYYGRKVPKHAHGTVNFEHKTSSSAVATKAVLELFDREVDPALYIRRLNLSVNHVISEIEAEKEQEAFGQYVQMDLFTDYGKLQEEKEKKEAAREKERKLQEAMLSVKKKYGKNAMLKGVSLKEGATAQERNKQIGGHRS